MLTLNMQISKKDFTPAEVKAMVRILALDLNKPLPHVILAESIGIKPSTNYLYDILKILEKDGVLTVRDSRNIAKRKVKNRLISIDKKKLERYILNQNETKFWARFFEENCILIAPSEVLQESE